MEIKSSLLNSEDFKFVKESLIYVSEQDGKEKFRVKMLEYINDSADNDEDEFCKVTGISFIILLIMLTIGFYYREDIREMKSKM